MKRPDLLRAVMQRLGNAAGRGGLTCEPRGAEVAGPSEYVVTVYGTPAEVVRLAQVLEQDPELRDVQLMEDVSASNPRFQSSRDPERRRHLHIALSAPTIW
jgi:hypothetical protein